MAQRDPRDPYTVEQAMADARQGVAGMNPEVQTLARSGITEPARRALAEQQNQIEDIEREQRQAQDDQQREAERQQREADKAQRAAKRKAGPVGQPIEQPPMHGPGLSGESQVSVTTQKFRDDRGREVTEPVRQETDPKTGERYIETKDAFGRPQRKVLGIDPKHAQRQAIDQEEGKIALRGNALAQTRLQFEPRWQPVKAEYLKAKDDLESIKPIERNPTDGSWFRATESGKLEYFDQVAVAKHFDRLNKAKARFEQAERAFKPEDAKNAQLSQAERQVKLDRLKLDARRKRLDLGLPDEDGGIAETLVQAESGERTQEAEAAAAAADEVIDTPKPIAESEVLTAALGNVAGIEGAVIEGTDVGYSWIYRPDGAKIGRIDNRSGQPVVVIDSEATDLQSHIAKTGGTGAVPVYAADHPERPPLAEEAGWAAGVLQTVTNPVAGPLNDGQAKMPAIDPNPMLREMGASHAEIIQKAKDGRLSIKTAEALLKTVYDDTLLAPDPVAPETRQAWLAENPDTMAAFQKATATRDHETLARLQGEFANDWYSKNQHKPGVTFEMQRQIRGQGLPEKTMGEVASGLAKSAGGIGVDAAGSFGGMIGGLAAFAGLKVAGTVSDTAAELGDSQQAVLGRAFTNFNNGLKDFHSKHATAEGKARANTLTQSDRNLRSLIERRHEMGPEQFRDQFFAAAAQIGRDAYALHQLSEEDGWKVDIEDFDIAADAPLRNALLSYAETGDPAQWESFQRRLLMDKGSRQADSLAQDNIDPKQGRLAAAFAGGVNAPPQEMMMEALFTVATYGTGKALTAAAKATGQGQRLNRIRRAASGIGAEFKAAGRFTDTLANPASMAKRAVNKATDILKVQTVEGAGEGVEGTISGMAEPGATPESALESGMLEAVGGVIMGPVLGGAGALSASYGESVDRKKQVAKFAGWYNRANADTEGFTPISPQDAEAALSMLDPAQHQALIDADQAAGQELKAAGDSLALSKPFALSPKQRESLETEAAELERALNDDATSDQTGKPAMAPAARESATEKLAEIQSRLRDADEAPVSRYSRALAGSIQARTAVSSYVGRVVEAAQSVKSKPAAERARALGLTKVATGRVDLLTGAERSAIAGATTREGAPYFATVGGRDVFTAEGRAELLQDDPLIGSLVQTDESRALIDQSAAAQAQAAPAQDKAKTSQPVGAQPPTVPQAQNPAPQAQAKPASTPEPATPADTQPAAKDKKADITRPAYRVEKRGGKSAVVADGLPEPVWEGKEEDSAAALKRAQDAADSPLAVANRAKRRLEARYPALKGKIRLDDESPPTGGGGVEASAEGITFNMADLEREMPLYDPEARDARVDAGLDEEVIHLAQFAAAEKLGVDAVDYYKALWKEFTPAQQQAGADVYQGNWDKLEPWQKAAEIVRMLIQAKRSGRVTEVTKAFSKAFPAQMLELLAAALEYLRGLGSKVSPRIQATIDAVEAILAEQAGTAGNRTKAEAAAADAAVQGEAVIEGTDAKLTTPNNERTIDVKQTVVELGQLVGSGDPRFPSLAFQPRDRSGAASAAQLDEMARNLASNPEQYRRYLEGSTTDTGRPLVAPLMEGGKQAVDDQGRPLFYVLSGNGRRNAIAEADRRGTAGQFYDSIREATGATAEKPVPVSIYQPADGADAIQIAELSNRDAGLSVSNTEQAIRDARDVEPILSLWSPDESGNASAASNRDFIRAFVKATGDTGILAGDGSLTEEGALRIDRALLATLLGPRNKPVLEMIFNRDLGLRNAISGIASEAGNLLRIAVEKPAYDLSAVLADALRQAVEARSAIEAATATTAADYFDQGDLFADNSDSPAKQLARALAETRSKKAVREILGTYRQAADQIDTTTEDMFGGVATRDDLIARALDARPFERIAQEVAAEFGAQSSIARKLAAGTAAVKRLTPSDRRSLAAAIGYEVERLREGIPSAEEFQATFEPGQLEPRAAFLQRWLDSHTPDSIDWEAMGKARAAVLAASPTRDIEVPNEVFRALAKSIHAKTKQLRAYDAKFQGLVREAAGDNPEWFPLADPVKKIERSVEKAQGEWLEARKQGLDMTPEAVAASLKDIVRASIIVQDAADFPAAIESIGRRFKILRIKNRWENPLPSGYADILINVETPLGESEIQLHIPEMLVAKEGWFPGLPEEFKPLVPLEMTGHKLYEEQRTLSGQPSEKERLDALDEMMFALYGAALRAHFARTNSRPPATWLNRAFTSSSVAGTSLKLTGFVSPNDPSALIARVALSTNKPGRSVSPSSANRAPGGTVKTASITPDAPSAPGENQAVSITSENIRDFAGSVDAAALAAESDNLAGAFDLSQRHIVVPLSDLVSRKNELTDPKFLAGTKKDPRQTAADWMLKAIRGEDGAKKRAPLDVIENADGTFTIDDGNATAQAMMLAGWTQVPIAIKPVPTLSSSGTLDLFGPDLFGPVAETKRKAVAAAKKNPAARAGVAKQIAAIEKVDDLDLFSKSVVKALANPPAKRQRRRNDSDSGQLGFAFGSDLPAGQQAVGPDRAPRVRPADGAPSGNRGSRGADRAVDDLGSARGDLAGGSRDDGTPDDADGRGGRPVAGDRAGSNGDRQPRRDDAGRRILIERERPPLDSPDRNFRIGKDTVLAEGGAVTRIKNNIAAIDLLRSQQEAAPTLSSSGTLTPEPLPDLPDWTAFQSSLKSADKDARPGITSAYHAAHPEAAANLEKRRELGIPPAWTNVEIFPPESRVLAKGRDSVRNDKYPNGRPQAKYNAEHTGAALASKFARLKKINAAMPDMVARIAADLNGRYREEASVLRLIRLTGFRNGGDSDTGAKVKAYGASTLLSEHVEIEGDTIHFDFVGKLGVRQQHSIRDADLAADMTERKARGGRLFRTHAKHVLAYLKKIGGPDFKVHDFRTWNATMLAARVISSEGMPVDPVAFWLKRDQVGDIVARKLGDTRKIVLESYIDPIVFEKWREYAKVSSDETRPKLGRNDVKNSGPAGQLGRSFGDYERALRDELLPPGSPAGTPSGGRALTQPALAAAPTLSDTTAETLATMTPLYRNVFAAVLKGEPVADIAKRYSITDRAVKNITDQVRARIRTLTAASSDEGLKPAMRDGKFNGGRPDLALSTNPAVAAVDQIRQQENVPDVRGHAEVNAEAEALLARDYAGTFDTLLAKARDLQPFTDTEVAAAKILISRETLSGKIQTPEERRKIAKLITGYRDIGTETARSLAIRRDPHKTPAERHAQYIAEALFTPDPETRERMRKNRGLQDSILDQWLTRANGIKEALKADGFDIDATLAAFQEATAARKEAAAAAPRAAAAVEDEIRRLDPTSRAVVEAIRSGSNWTAAAMSAGIDIADAKARYAKFREKVTEVMRGAARRYLAATLSASPTATESSILAELGLPDPDDIAESSTVPSVNRQKRKAAPRKSAKPARPLARPDMTLEDYAARPLDGTRTLPPRPMEGIDGNPIDSRGEFDPANPDPIGKELEPWKHGAPISGGLFDLNDPLAMKKVMDAFAIARGTKFDALLEFWRMSILTGPQTHIVNISSNVLHGIYDLLPRRTVEAGINGMLGIVGQGSPEAATFGEFAGMARQLYAAAARAGRNALSSWRLESRVFEAQALALAQQLDFSGVKADYIPPALGGKLGTIMRSLSFRAMTAADEMMKSFLGQLEAAAHSHRIAKSEGLKGAAYDARIAELMEPGSIAWIRAVDSTKRITFQSDLNPENPQLLGRLDQVAEALKKARRARHGWKLLTFFLPFIDTPTNIFKIAMEMSPMGAAIALFDAAHALKVKLVRGDLTKEEADAAAEEIYNRARLVRDLTNQTIAWGAFYALQGMTEADDDDETGLPQITGSVSYTNTRRGERDVMFRTMPPQSIRIGGMIFSYRRFEPFATALSGAVDAIRAIRVSGGVNDEALSLYMGGIKDGLKDKTFLSGLSDLINAFENPDRFAPTLAGNVVTGFVPNLIRQPLRETDEFMRDDSARPDEGFFEAIGKKLGSTVAPGTLPAKIDVWGNPIRRHNGPASDSLLRILDPTDANLGANVDPIDRYILNWNLSADAKARLAIEPIGDSVSSRGQRITLTPAEQEEANRRAGQRARASLGDSWDWRNPSPQGIDRIRDAVRNAQDAERDRIRATKQPDPDQRN